MSADEMMPMMDDEESMPMMMADDAMMYDDVKSLDSSLEGEIN